MCIHLIRYLAEQPGNIFRHHIHPPITAIQREIKILTNCCVSIKKSNLAAILDFTH